MGYLAVCSGACLFVCLFVLLLLDFLRYGFTLGSNSREFSCIDLPSAEILGMHHHARARNNHFSSEGVDDWFIL